LPFGETHVGLQEPELEGKLSLPHVPRFGFDYWLARCAGYRVDGVDGSNGVVDELRFGRRHDRPDFLVVRTGRVIRHRRLVRTEDVVSISPREQRVVLAAAPAPLAPAP
jgi:hypothetical protein